MNIADDVPGELTNALFPRWAFSPGVFVQADWEPTPRVLIRPGVRLDHYEQLFAGGGTVRQTGVNPRISARVQVSSGVYVKGGVGVYQSPPRFIVPWPGLEGIGLSQGLNRSYQASMGAEVRLPWNATLDGQLYYNWMPNISEYPIGDESARPATHDSGQATYRGRAYGFELIARAAPRGAAVRLDHVLAGARRARLSAGRLAPRRLRPDPPDQRRRLVRARARVDGLERLPLQHGPPLHPRHQ